jgi:hypothetical protein
MSPIYLSLASPDFKVLLFADDIVIFSSDKYLDRSVYILNSALKFLSSQLSSSFFRIAPQKSNIMIFTSKRISIHPHLVLDNNIIQSSSSVNYLDLKLDSKLR